MKIVIIHGQSHKGSTYHIANSILRNSKNVKPGLKTKGFFWMMHFMQKNGFNQVDAAYWKEKGWTGKQRPWN